MRFALVAVMVIGLVSTLFSPNEVKAGMQYASQFGSAGSGDGQFDRPFGIALDSAGNIYVTDSTSHRVQKFDPTGTYISQFGSFGSGDGQFNGPQGIAVDSSGNVYVADELNSRVQKFDSNGDFVSYIGGPAGSDDGEFGFVHDIAIDGSGNILVVDSDNSRIQKFDSDGNYISQFGNNQFSAAQGIAVDASGNIFVTEYNAHRVQKFDSAGNFILTFGQGVIDGNREYQVCTSDCQPGLDAQSNADLGRAQDVSIDNYGTVYVTSSSNARIRAFTNDGKYLFEFGSDGSGDGEFGNSGQATAFDAANNIYVTDGNNGRIQKFIPTLVSPSVNALSVEEGDSSTFTYVLDRQPANDVIVTLSTSTPGVGAGASISPEVLTFMPGNWDEPQTVTVTGIDDGVGNPQRTVDVSASVSSADSDFNGVIISNVVVTVSDNEALPIANCAELQAMSEGLGASYELSNDIDCTGFDADNDGKGFRPVGDDSIPFTGSFDGNGHTISNLTIARPDEYYVGLFGYVQGGTFKDVSLAGNVEGLGNVGSLIGLSDTNDLVVENVFSSADVTGHGTGVGGVIASMDLGPDSTLTNVHYDGTITVDGDGGQIDSIGGLSAGGGGSGSTISDSSASGAIVFNHVNASQSSDVGGLVAYFEGASITNSSSTMDISIITDASGQVANVGGLVGAFYNEVGIVDGVSYSGTIHTESNGPVSLIGGLFGDYGAGSITDSIADADIEIQAPSGAVTYIGGLNGYSYIYPEGNIDDVQALGSITIDSAEIYDIGGMTGFAEGEASEISFARSRSSVEMHLDSDAEVAYVGGFVGQSSMALSFTDSYWSGQINATGTGAYIAFVGGMIGYHDTNPSIFTRTYAAGQMWLDSADAVSNIGGMTGYDIQAQYVDSFSAVGITVVSVNPTSNIGAVTGSDYASFDNTFFDKTLSGQDFCNDHR